MKKNVKQIATVKNTFTNVKAHPALKDLANFAKQDAKMLSNSLSILIRR